MKKYLIRNNQGQFKQAIWWEKLIYALKQKLKKLLDI